jgi:hypothetical protein
MYVKQVAYTIISSFDSQCVFVLYICSPISKLCRRGVKGESTGRFEPVLGSSEAVVVEA